MIWLRTKDWGLRTALYLILSPFEPKNPQKSSHTKKILQGCFAALCRLCQPGKNPIHWDCIQVNDINNHKWHTTANMFSENYQLYLPMVVKTVREYMRALGKVQSRTPGSIPVYPALTFATTFMWCKIWEYLRRESTGRPSPGTRQPGHWPCSSKVPDLIRKHCNPGSPPRWSQCSFSAPVTRNNREKFIKKEERSLTNVSFGLTPTYVQ